MNNLNAFKRKLATISRFCDKKDYDSALAETEEALKTWPGNGHLLMRWASLVQLQEKPKHSLNDARQALRQAVDLDTSSPAAALELGYFLNNVEDNPTAAIKMFTEGVTTARQLLIDGLLGQAKACLQMHKKKEARRCLLEALQLMEFEPAGQRERVVEESIEDLLTEVAASRSA